MNAKARNERPGSFPGWYIDIVISSDGQGLRSMREIPGVFRANFHDRLVLR